MQQRSIPPHIPAQLVVDFDIYALPLTNVADPQTAYAAFREKGDIFWTPLNGGHWVFTRAEDLKAAQSDWTRFSRAPGVSIPPVQGKGRSIPMGVDPPEHATFRKPLTMALMPKVVEAMAEKVRATTTRLIDAFLDRGECDFVHEFSQIFPILVFLDLVDLPASDRTQLLPLAEILIRGSSVEERMGAYGRLGAYLQPVVEARRANPGDDLFSKMVNVEVNGEKIALTDAIRFCLSVTVAGLDTVAAMLGFITRHFAIHHDHRREMGERIGDEAFVRNAVEELIRRYAIANSARGAACDFTYKGVNFAKGDMILTANVFAGTDEQTVDRPMEVDFHRTGKLSQTSFDVGPHTCPGANLARRELRVFIEEWFRRIPDFAIKPGTTPRMATGMVSSVLALELVWPTPQAAPKAA